MGLRHELGKQGEESSVSLLMEKGYAILGRNYRYGRAEVDIIARQKDVIVFVEVKTRTNYAFGHPEESISLTKQKLMVKAATQYLYENKLEFECRFDVIAVFRSADGKWQHTHYEDAFFLYD